jgi:hypothetical protein
VGVKYAAKILPQAVAVAVLCCTKQPSSSQCCCGAGVSHQPERASLHELAVIFKNNLHHVDLLFFWLQG